MAQLTIYLDEEAHRLILAAASEENVSLSKWARDRLVSAASPSSWPNGFFELFGSVADESFEEPEELDASLDQCGATF